MRCERVAGTSGIPPPLEDPFEICVTMPPTPEAASKDHTLPARQNPLPVSRSCVQCKSVPSAATYGFISVRRKTLLDQPTCSICFHSCPFQRAPVHRSIFSPRSRNVAALPYFGCGESMQTPNCPCDAAMESCCERDARQRRAAEKHREKLRSVDLSMLPLIVRKTAVGVVPDSFADDEDDESTSYSGSMNWTEENFFFSSPDVSSSAIHVSNAETAAQHRNALRQQKSEICREYGWGE